MVRASIGGLIKDYRIKDRLSQIELALAIGWKDTVRLSQLEQGRIGKPDRKTIDRIILALNLSIQERGDFLRIGGYLPTEREVEEVMKDLQSHILLWPYPAYLLDFSWRVFIFNEAAINVFRIPKLKESSKKRSNLLESAFLLDPTVLVSKGDDINNVRPLAECLVAQYKSEHMGYENEKWYQTIVNQLASHDTFRRLWGTIEASDYHKKLHGYEYKIIQYPQEKKELHFHTVHSTYVKDQRFNVTLYFPADL